MTRRGASGAPRIKRLEARGTLCPLPTVMVALALETMGAGDVVDVLADDPTTRRDLAGWCQEFGHPVLGIFDLPMGFRVRIQKGHSSGLDAQETHKPKQ